MRGDRAHAQYHDTPPLHSEGTPSGGAGMQRRALDHSRSPHLEREETPLEKGYGVVGAAYFVTQTQAPTPTCSSITIV